jgi:hypothetical protein
MKSAAVCFVAMLSIPLLICTARAQVGIPADQGPRRQRSEADIARERVEMDTERRMTAMRHQEAYLRAITRQRPTASVEPRLTREERDRVVRLRRVSSLDAGRYEGLLKGDRTGIFKLFPDLGCISKTVISVAGECERFVPMSSSFTFRTNAYGDDIYHDIHFENDRISSKSFFSQGIFGVIGEEPIEGITLAHPALGFLGEFPTATDPTMAAQFAEQLQAGVDSGGYKYADHVIPRENVTYALRMIAYRLENVLKPLSDDTTRNELMFHSLAFDKRVDITVVFRVLTRDENGGLTIVWKELDRKSARKIKFGKNQVLRDFRPDNK